MGNCTSGQPDADVPMSRRESLSREYNERDSALGSVLDSDERKCFPSIDEDSAPAMVPSAPASAPVPAQEPVPEPVPEPTPESALQSTPAAAPAPAKQSERDIAASLDEPPSAFFQITKQPRGGLVKISGEKHRILTIHLGNLRYFKDDKALIKEPPFVESAPQGEMRGGVAGCTLQTVPEDKERRTLRIRANGKDNDLIVSFVNSEQLDNFMHIFEDHRAYYAAYPPVPKLNSKGVREI